MKRLITFIAASLFFTLGVFAQTPDKLNYQALIKTAANEVAANQTIGVQISILQGSAAGDAVYVETQNPNTNANGLMTLQIGEGTVVSGDFAAIDWSSDTFYIKSEIDLAGGAEYTITGVSQLVSVPYALHAKTAEAISGDISETDPVFSGSEAANLTATDLTNLSNLSGVNTGDQDISGIAVNASAISTLEAEQETQNAAIAVNTAKLGITEDQAAIIANTSGTNTGDQDISGIAVNASAISTLEAEQETQNAAIAVNTAKLGITEDQAVIISNTSGTNTGDQDISGIAVNASAISTLEAEQETQNAAIALNTAKVGVTPAQAAIIANTSGTNTGDQDISGIAVNASAISTLEAEQETQNAAIALNTAKASNATHTGDVTGSEELTIAEGAVTVSKIGTEGEADANKVLTTDATGTPQWTAYKGGVQYGDVKNGLQAADHSGWVLLDGRELTTLTATQQAQAAALGIVGNLPNAENTYLSQNGDALGSVSGSNSITINQNNLPNVNLSGSTSYTPNGTVGSHSHKTSTASSLYGVIGGGYSIDVDDVGGIGEGNGLSKLNSSNTSSVAPSFTGTTSTISITNIRLNGNQSQESIDIKPRSLSVNVFLYLGE